MAYEYNNKQRNNNIIYNFFCQVKLKAKLNNIFFFQDAIKKAKLEKN